MANEVYAVISHLSGQARAEVLAIWELLERRFGTRAARAAAEPHITYVVGDGGDPRALAASLAAAAAAIAPLDAAIDGLGMFPGPPPVVYLRVVHSAALGLVYAEAARRALHCGVALWPNYAPETWVPHVTLALRDVAPAAVPAIMAELARRPLRIRAPIGDIRLVRVRRAPAQSEYLASYPLRHS